MDRDRWLEKSPYSASQREKQEFFNREIGELSEHHRRACKSYDDICNGLGEESPYLPVSIFKSLDLCSVEEEEVLRKVTSSGTTGQQVSKIYLDGQTSIMQQRALCMIAGDYIGTKRIPMLIIDSPDVLRDRKKYSARGAGIMGFSMMASKRFYALDNSMNLDWEALHAFEEEAARGPVFAFGFTYMIWEYFYKKLKASERKPNLKNCHLIHGGGWKKLQNIKVSDRKFKEGLGEVCGLERISDYYGMAEQTGSIFMECEEGHLHSSIYSDISILAPADFSPCEDGQWGLIALQSFLPRSYPGHMLLTEDWGRIVGTDDCPCNRKGRYFQIEGRIPKAEIRGCSDTFGGGAEDGNFQLLAGAYPVREERFDIFSDLVMEFTDRLSRVFTREERYRKIPEIYALGFWCRRAHIEKLRDGYIHRGSKRGKGTVLHIAPSNMPTMFAYSWITALLGGNSSIVRLSTKESPVSSLILQGIREVLEDESFSPIRESNAFITFPRGDELLEEISSKAAGRIIWGGDETVDHIASIKASPGCTDILFPDRYSIGFISSEYVASIGEDELANIVHRFYNDTYGADQNACSSPKTVIWIEDTDEDRVNFAKKRWWDSIAEKSLQYDLQPWMATEKYRMLCCAYPGRSELDRARRWGNRLYVIPVKGHVRPLHHYQCSMGMFYEMEVSSIEELTGLIDHKIQTIVSIGMDPEELEKSMAEYDNTRVDRIVIPGQALQFDTVWDRKDIIDLLSE